MNVTITLYCKSDRVQSRNEMTSPLRMKCTGQRDTVIMLNTTSENMASKETVYSVHLFFDL